MDEFREGEGTPVAYAPPPAVFDCERLTPELVSEVGPLLMAHWREVAGDKDIPLSPRWDIYSLLEGSDKLFIYTARIRGRLVGYNAFFVDPHVHYGTALQATNDVVFIDPRERGFGRKFLAWCAEHLRAAGVQLMSYHVKKSHDWGHVLAEQGFLPREVVWVKRLDK